MGGSRGARVASLGHRALRWMLNDTVLALLGVLAAIAVLAFAGVVLTWFVFRERYGLGFVDYLTEVVF